MHRTRSIRWAAGALIAVVCGTLVPAAGAHASSEGTRNTAWVATAAAAALAYRYAQKPSTGRIIPAAAATGVAVLAWNKANQSAKRERAAQQARIYAAGRRSGYRTAAHQSTSYRTAGYRSSAKHKKACRR